MKLKNYLLKFSLYASVALIGACGVNYVSNKNLEDFISSNENSIETKVIYGEDNRKDLYSVNNDRAKKFEASVVGLTRKSRVVKKSNGNYTVLVNSYGKERQLCKSERFYDQKMTTHCSGVLINKNTILTAGHCIPDLKKCKDTTFVFGLTKHKKNQNINYSDVPANNVYQCKGVVYTVAELGGLDFAVVTLDRNVKNRKGLSYRQFGQPKKGDDLFMIGKPSGLPTKVTEAGKLHSLSLSILRTDLDAYGANSGSPIFNTKTGDIEGILIRGALDFVYDRNENCFRSHVCDYVKKDTQCTGEEATRISKVLPYLPTRLNLFEESPGIDIPDSPADGIYSSLTIESDTNYSEIFVHIDIEHTWTGDLTVSLTSPSGDSITLVDNSGSAGDNLKVTLGNDKELQQELIRLAESGLVGNWKLKVSDGFSRDVGVLNRWALELK